MTRTLSVWWDGVAVGALQVNQHGQMRFTYAGDWLADPSRPPISFSLPKQEQPFKQNQCRPFFAGLLPEDGQRDIIAGALGISKGTRGRAVFLAGRRGAAHACADGHTTPVE